MIFCPITAALAVQAVDSYVEDMHPSGGVYEKRPNDPDRCIEGSPRTARIRHRSFTSLSSTRKAAQLERDDSLFQQHVLRRRLA